MPGTGLEAADEAFPVTQLCYDLASELYSIIREARDASSDGSESPSSEQSHGKTIDYDVEIMQDTLAALHLRLYQIHGLFKEDVPQSPREKDYRASIISTLDRIRNDLLSLTERLRIRAILAAEGSARLEAWADLQRKFKSDDIQNIKERLTSAEAHLQSHFEMFSLFMAFKMQHEFTEPNAPIRLIRPILKKLLRDAAFTQQRQRSEFAESRSIRLFRRTTGAHDASNNASLECDSDLTYHDEFERWKVDFEGMIESVVDLPLHQVSNSRYVPSILNESRDGHSIASTSQDFIEANRASLSPIFGSDLPYVAEEPEEPLQHDPTEAAVDWCKQQGYPVSGSNFRFDLSLETASGELKGLSPIHQAIKQDNMSVLEQMLSGDCDVEVRLQSGPEDVNPFQDATPFLLACSTRNVRAARLLLSKGAKADAKDCTGKTGLHLCQTSSSRSGGRRIAELLLEDPRAEALDVNAQDKYGQTAAHIAARVGNVGMLEYLLLEGNGKKVADANAQQNDGSTPLMVALTSSITNKKQVINVLLKHSDLEIKNDKGKNAKSLAKEYSERDCYKHLRDQIHIAQGKTSSRRMSESTTVFSRIPTTQSSEDVCSACKQHCPQWKDCKLTIDSSTFSQDWIMSLRKLSSSRSSIGIGSIRSIRSAR
ncbi:ankyrin repeat [Fusarium beomiforme]|uniref:Ankyrin repeat n=1 Tax=Fusarium beomiforme TaxID=44412 RepID=A0A9P5DRU0_9HYPO|nr:ankyrin repeat [Fusarium beomiforme]